MGNVSGKDGEDGSNGYDLGMIRSASRSDPLVAVGSRSSESMAITSATTMTGSLGVITVTPAAILGSSSDPVPPQFASFIHSSAPLPMYDGPSVSNPMWQNDSQGVVDASPEQGIPTIITWNYVGNNVQLKDHAITGRQESNWKDLGRTIRFCWCSYLAHTIISFC